MHQISELSQFNIAEMTKIEGAAGLDVTLKDGHVETVHFKIDEFKRFYTTAMEGKPVAAIPQLLARICGTCSNAHLMAAIEAVEHVSGITPSPQTRLLRELTYHGLIIRDHALHLYVFALPDVFGRDSLLEFDDHDPLEHQLLHDAFAIKSVGNHLAILVAGRSVHAPYPMPGGFTHLPDPAAVKTSIEELKNIREAVLRGIEVFLEIPFSLVRETKYLAMTGKDFSYLEGEIRDMHGVVADEAHYRELLEHTVIPYSQASGYTFDGEHYRVGALARLNINKAGLHPNTQRDAALALKVFPSHNIFHNNLAQAIAILHSIDRSIDILSTTEFVSEAPQKLVPAAGVGVGVVEAPRGTLYHKIETDERGIVIKGEVIVPTGQNQIAIEEDLRQYIEGNLDKTKEEITIGCERIIRAYDPCMSCATHFLTVNWMG